MKPYNKDRAILQKITNYCEEIDQAVAKFGDDFTVFAGDPVYRNACALCILQIGELCNVLSSDFRQAHSEMPWNQIRGMRNVVAHAYGTISSRTTWDTIKQDIPALRNFCQKHLLLKDSSTPTEKE